jgi:hypothetical protein
MSPGWIVGASLLPDPILTDSIVRNVITVVREGVCTYKDQDDNLEAIGMVGEELND